MAWGFVFLYNKDKYLNLTLKEVVVRLMELLKERCGAESALPRPMNIKNKVQRE